jgi:RecG-like helicase
LQQQSSSVANYNICVVCAFPFSLDELPTARGILLSKVVLECYCCIQVFVLHSVVPKEEQEAAMQPAMHGHCKVVLSTNIAESSITIPDVRLIINSGLQRYVLHPSCACLSIAHSRNILEQGYIV